MKPKVPEENARDGLEEPWVRTHGYEGPDRRSGRKRLFQLRKERLDDVGSDSGELVETESLQTLMRRLRVWSDLAHATLEQRAFLVSALEAIEVKGTAEGAYYWPELVRETALYMRAVGAKGRIDEDLLQEALLTASAAQFEGEAALRDDALIERLRKAARDPH